MPSAVTAMPWRLRACCSVSTSLPEVSGFEVVDALKGDPTTAGIPIVIVTARDLSAADRQRLNGRIHEMVDKVGFDEGRFLGEVRRALAQGLH